MDVAGGTKNWTHCNAILYDESDDSFVLSLRHLDWIVKISRESGELLWTMGEGGDFTIAGEGEWFYHQHAPMLLEPGRIILFDNGNLRPEYELATFFTRTLEFTYDEAGKTFSEAWKWQDDEPFYSQYVGDSDRLGNTNVLIGDGGRVEDQSQPLTNPFNLKWYRIVEVTDNKEVVWEMQAQDFSGDVFGYSLYRAQRWSSIYPEVIATEE